MIKNTSRIIIQLYAEHITSDQILNVLTSKKSIKRWAYILHDKDPGKPHYHVMIDFGRSYEVSRIYDWFDHPGLETSNLIEQVKSWTAFVQYLIHKNDQDKYQYEVDQVKSNYDISDDLSAVAESLIPNWFGDFDNVDYNKQLIYINSNIRNIQEANKRFDQLQKRYKLYLLAQEDAGRDVKVIFIEGNAGIGKTTFAKWYAKQLGKSYFVAGSSNDPLDGYTSQHVLILDDLRDNVWSLTDLLKILDNHTGSLMKSRYYNKRFNGTHILITSTIPLRDWYRGSPTAESLSQLYRRINDYVVLEKGQGTYYRKVSHSTGSPMDDVTTETVPFDANEYANMLRDHFQDDIEVSNVLDKMKSIQKKGSN
jgi:hypothetical protein